MKTYQGPITIKTIPKNGILVFGSNTQGRHGLGMALFAKKYFGAIYGQARGLQGRSYAIVTKDLTKKTHPSITPEAIILEIRQLYCFAEVNNSLQFYIPYMNGPSNLNAYSSLEMAGMFKTNNYPENIMFEESFWNLMEFLV